MDNIKSMELKALARIGGLSVYSKYQKVDLIVALIGNSPLLQNLGRRK